MWRRVYRYRIRRRRGGGGGERSVWVASSGNRPPPLPPPAALVSSFFYTATSSSSGPPPIRVKLTESAGRGVFATRRIEGGELIHTAKPLISHPYLSAATSVCYLCLRKLNNNINLISLHHHEAASPPPPPLPAAFCTHKCKHQSKGFHEIEKQADWSAHTEHCCTQGLKYPFLAKRLACMVVSGVAAADALDILQPAILSHEMILKGF